MYDDVIESAAKQFAIDPNLIKAVIRVESNWDPNAVRQEPQINDVSYGLMQLLLGTAKSVSGNSNLTVFQLSDPTLNIMLGTKYLRQLWDKYGNLEDTIASYNAGSPIRSALGGYVNQGYVDKVKLAYTFYNNKYVVMLMSGLVVGGIFLWNKK